MNFGAPIIKAGMWTTQPCYGFDKDRLVLDIEQLMNLQFSVEKESPLEMCPDYEWRNRTFDSRYTKLGEISLYDLQKENGVLYEINKLVPLDALDP